jgi:hypothetical protein
MGCFGKGRDDERGNTKGKSTPDPPTGSSTGPSTNVVLSQEVRDLQKHKIQYLTQYILGSRFRLSTSCRSVQTMNDVGLVSTVSGYLFLTIILLFHYGLISFI